MRKNKRQEVNAEEAVQAEEKARKRDEKLKKKQEKKRNRRKRKKGPIILVVVIVLFIVIRMVACGGNDEAVAVVNTTQAIRGELQESVSTSGTVLSEEVKVVFAPVSGTLAEVNVAAGDAVKSGELLVSYNVEKLENSLRESELQYQKSEANYNDALAEDSNNQWLLYEATHNIEILEKQIAGCKERIKQYQNELDDSQRNTNNAIAQENLSLTNKLSKLQAELAALTPGTTEYTDKQKEMQKVNDELAQYSYLSSTASTSDYVSEMQRKIADEQELLSGYETYKAEMEAQKSASENQVMSSYDKKQYSADNELASMNYQSTEADYALARNGITAEFDGIVTECSAISGAGVSSGVQLLKLESSDNLKVSFQASKSDIEKLELGQKADVVISGRTYQGEISKINRMAEKNASGTPMVGVEIHLLEVSDEIILGMDAKLTIYTHKAENALLIPVEAINADRDGDFLYVVENGIAVKKSVICGISTDTYTEILEGITEEDVIIQSAFTSLEEGMAVTVMPVAPVQ